MRRTGPTSAAVEYRLPKGAGFSPNPQTSALPESETTASDGTQADEIRPQIPEFWVKGQLLNVRNNGAEYVVTLLGEEFDPRYPHRALKFDNSFACQSFISSWYAREHSDPRAL